MMDTTQVLRELYHDYTCYIQEWDGDCELRTQEAKREDVPKDVFASMRAKGYLQRVSISRYMLSSAGVREGRKLCAKLCK